MATKAKAGLLTTILRWIDSSAGIDELPDDLPHKVDWLRVVPFLFLHLVCLSVIWVGWSPIACGVAFFLYFIRMFAITGFYHRYFSHRSFKTSRVVQFLMGVLGNSAAQRGPLWWAAHHRHHHRHSDLEDDIHSPVQSTFMWSHMLWFTSLSNFKTNESAVRDLAQYPELRFLDRFNALVPLLLAIGLFCLGVWLETTYPGLGTSGWQMLVWGFFISTVFTFHATFTINSLSHKFGTKRFDTGDESRNNFWLALLTLGEGWHNNHHHYPGSTRQGFYWWEIDITYYMLLAMQKLGLIWELRPVPEKALNTRRLDS